MQKYINYLLYFALFCLGLYLGGFLFPSETTEYQSYIKSDTELVADRALEIRNSEEFQNEMTAIATARALYQISNERQATAVDMAEMALMTYQESQEMAKVWTSLELAKK